MSWFGLFDDVADIAKEAIEDKDLRNQLNAKLNELREQVYMAELNTKTVPWVDAVHKMGRQIISILNVVVPAVVIYFNPDVNPLVFVAMAGPSAIYNHVKGKGK